MATIVLDDSTNRISYGGAAGSDGGWSRVQVQRFFGGSAIWPPFSVRPDANGDTGTYGTFSITFQGTSIAFTGNTPPHPMSQTILVSIDGGTPSQASYSDQSPPSALQWYKSPSLSEGTHTVSITHMAGVSVDFMTITAGQNTPLSGERLIVDDDDSAITYSGNWARKTGRYRSKDLPSTGLPYGGATHQSGTSGSSATFQFTGTSVEVYSLFDWSHLGTLGVTYTIDSSPSPRTHSVTTDTAEYKEGILHRENFLLFSSDSLSPGDHTLKIEVTSSTNGATLVLDYILYKPSFDTLAAKPVLKPPPITPASSSVGPSASGSTQTSVTPSSGIASGSSSGMGTNTIPGAPSASSSSSNGSGATSNSGSNSAADTGSNLPASRSIPAGAIVGGVVGGLAIVAFLIFLVLYRKRISGRSSPPVSNASPEAPGRSGLLSVDPFMGILPATGASNYDSDLTPQRKGMNPFLAPMASSVSGSRSDTASGILDAPCSSLLEKHPMLLSNPGPDSPARTLFVESRQTGSGMSTSGTGGVTAFQNRMQRLQDLVLELNRTIGESGEESARALELRGRIAELTREDAGHGEMVERRQSVATTAVPPPYEPRRS
ncbi:hypothetical protein FPV67DRAFT_1513958 [Lyophyllum atratum]|nr:hypothetical protein FPV67DRAFT_1513958 [Lyophyllum atratum]